MASLSGLNCKFKTIVLASVSAIVLTACDTLTEGEAPAGRASNTQGIEGREIEVPDAYNAQSKALWDGRPSFGGAWIAVTDVRTPEQVRIENTANGRVIKAALYRRERDLPGPPIQVSMDAAQELGMQAGTPVELKVVAIRKEVIEVAPVVADEVSEDTLTDDGVEVAALGAADAIATTVDATTDITGEALPEITETTEVGAAPVGDLGATVPTFASATLEAVVGRSGSTTDAMFAAAALAADAAAAGVDDANTTVVDQAAEPLTGETVAAALAAVPSTEQAAASDQPLNYPFIQVSTVGSQADADAVIAKLKAAGLQAGARQTGERFAVLVGPLKTAAQQTAALANTKKMGYFDAFLTK